MRQRRSLTAAVLIATILLVASACSKADQTSSGSDPVATVAAGPSTVIPANEGTPVSGGALVFGIDTDPDGLDPVTNNFATNTHLIASSMLETLAVFNKDHKTEPYLAESITPENLASKWTIKIKPNIKFQDGAALDAAAVKANLDAQLHGIASIAMKSVDQIVVVDPSTVEVDMNKPWASFPSFLSSQQGYMISPKTIGGPDAATKPVGTGPFMLDSWDRGTKIVTKKNPNYWQSGKPYLDRLEFRILNDPAARANALQSGEINVMFTDDPQTIATNKTKTDVKTVIDASGDAQSIYMNQAAEPFDNVNARKAVIQATDSNAVTESFGDGVVKPTDQPFSDSSPYHVADSHYAKYDLDAAKKSVAQYTQDTGKPLEFNLTTFTGAANLALAQVLQEQWAKAGIQAHVSAVDQSAAISDIIFGKVQAVLTPNFGYPDPDYYYTFWHSDFTAPVGQLSINFPHMKIQALDDALIQGRINLLPDKRVQAYQQATQIINDNFAYIWIYRYVAALIAANNVHGLGAAELAGFSNQTSKPWYQDLWLSKP